MDVSTVLRRSADLIEQHGWYQGGNGYGPHNEMCTARAMQHAVTGTPASQRVGDATPEQSAHFNRAGDFLVQTLGWPCAPALSGHVIPMWNDCLDRTQGEVITALRGAADIYDATEVATTRELVPA